jgi:hypothetical protein
MLLILLPIAWLAVVMFFVVICQLAARGDAIVKPARAPSRGRLLRPGVTVWDDAATLRSHGRASHVDRRQAGTQTTRTAGRALASHPRRSASHAGS